MKDTIALRTTVSSLLADSSQLPVPLVFRFVTKLSNASSRLRKLYESSKWLRWTPADTWIEDRTKGEIKSICTYLGAGVDFDGLPTAPVQLRLPSGHDFAMG